MNLFKINNLVLKLVISLNLVLVIVGLFKGREDFFTKDIVIVSIISVLYFILLNVKVTIMLIANLILHYFYIAFFFVTYFASGFGYRSSLNYPTYEFFRFDRSDELGDFLILIPIPFLLYNFFYNHYILIKTRKNR